MRHLEKVECMKVELEVKLLITTGQQPTLAGSELKMFHKRLQLVNDYGNECKEIILVLSDSYLDYKRRCIRKHIDDTTSYISATSPSAVSQSVASADYASSDTSYSTDSPEELTASEYDTIMATFAASEAIDITCTTISVLEEDSKMPPTEIDCISTTINETMEDDSKIPPTSAVVLIDSLSTLLYIGKHNMCSLTAVSKFLDTIIDIVQCLIISSTMEEQVFEVDGILSDRNVFCIGLVIRADLP